MTSVPHGPLRYPHERFLWAEVARIPELWASIAIVAIWMAVLFDAVFGPDFVHTAAATTTTFPSAIGVAFFAFLATVAVAKHGFRERKQ